MTEKIAVPQGLEHNVDSLADNVEVLVELATNQAKRLAELTLLFEQQGVDLRSIAGDHKAIRAFMKAHNTRLGELGARLDDLACVGGPCPIGGDDGVKVHTVGSRKTPSTEIKGL